MLHLFRFIICRCLFAELYSKTSWLVLYSVLFLAHKHLVKLHDDNQYIIEGVYFGENQMPWTIADVVHMKKGFIAELQHQMLAKAPICVRVSDSGFEACFNISNLLLTTAETVV